MSTRLTSKWSLRAAAVFAVVFGVLTTVSGATALFGGAQAQAAVGNAVPFVLWFNFLSGFAYVLAGVGIALMRDWAVKLSTGLAVAIAVVFVLFGLHVYQGAAFEMRTVGAMTFRLLVWIAIAVLACREMAACRTSGR